ncbi:MAG: NADH-quinone oxidoreductase subunit NuoE [Actinomycetales bacterium]|nr:NADH-quinone oxidoreductase subunit NuoE [Actinomycetales bacterium]
MALSEQTRSRAREIIARYPHSRSALLPMLHLVQAEEGYVSADGIALCAEELALTTAEVSAVATFYTMYHKKPVGEYHIGVCINPGCGILGGDAIWSTLCSRLGIGNDEVTEDGKISLERIECQAACTHAPVMTANWEFLDNMTPESAVDVVKKLRSGQPVSSTRGPKIPTFKENELLLAGFDDGLANEAAGSDEFMLAGLNRAKELGQSAPEVNS